MWWVKVVCLIWYYSYSIFSRGATARGAKARNATTRGATARGATARGATALSLATFQSFFWQKSIFGWPCKTVLQTWSHANHATLFFATKYAHLAKEDFKQHLAIIEYFWSIMTHTSKDFNITKENFLWEVIYRKPAKLIVLYGHVVCN